MMDYLARALELQPELVKTRRYLHRHAEVGFALDETTAFIREKLREMGYEPENIGDHGLTAIAGGKKPGKCILLRADMDALPMKEESGLPFACTRENAAHTCGHDMHSTMLLGAAKILKEMEDEIPGTVKILFQPGEETGLGCKAMVDAGILTSPKVDAAVGMHVIAAYPKGRVRYNDGPFSSSADIIRIEVRGKSAHGSTPQFAIDPINIAAHIVTNLQTLNAREIPALQPVVFTIGSFISGSAPNQIPEQAVLQGSLRTFDPEIRAQMLRRIEEISSATAEMFGGKAITEVPAGLGSVILDGKMNAEIGPALKKMLGTDAVEDHYPKVPMSEDFAFISDRVPSVFYLLGACPDGAAPVSQHNPKIIFDESVLPEGAAIYVTAAMTYLQKSASE